MRVLHVLDRSLPTIAGYTTRSAAIVEHQAALGLVPRALTSAREGGGETAVFRGVPHHRTESPDVVGFLDGLPVAREAAEMLALRHRILELYAERPFDVVHAHSPVLCGVPAHLAARRLGLPSVYEIRALWEDAAAQRSPGSEASARYRATRAVETLLVKRVDAVVTLCEGLRREIEARGVPPARLFVVPNGVDPVRFPPRPRDAELAARLGVAGKTVVAYLGSLFRFEGVPLLVEALARVCAEREEVRGLVVGKGEDEAEIARAVERHGLGGKVAVVGRASGEEVARYYSLADVLCYPRLRHRITELTTPLKPLEAMSMGKAVVASDVGGHRELVRGEETGVLFRAGDVGDLAAALTRAVGDAELRRRLGEQARAEVLAERAWPRIARRYVEIYATARARARAGQEGRRRGPEAT